jgi:hypothetical protein
MNTSFFKHRGRFDFSPHRYEIGRPVIQNKKIEDNFFLLKLYLLEEAAYPALYQFHLEYFLNINPNQEETFFNHVRDIVVSRIRHFKRLDPFSGNYAANMECTRKLEAFQKFLATVDQWQQSKPIENVINEKDILINSLKEQVKKLEAQVKEYSKYEAGEKIAIHKGNLPAFMDLVLQLQELTLQNDHKLLRSQAQSPWYKMIAKYFLHGEHEIPIDTARNYFAAQKQDKPAKFIQISEKDKLFVITGKKANT